MIISIDTEKGLWHNLRSFMIKICGEASDGKNMSLSNKRCMRKTYSQYPAKWRKTQHIPTKIKNKTRMSTLPTPIQYSALSLNWSSKTRKRIKRNINRERRSQSVLFANNMVLCIGHPKDPTKNFSSLINTFISKVGGYKINIQRLVAFLYTNGKHTEKEIPETIPFTKISKQSHSLT